jgi:hypothetical protein
VALSLTCLHWFFQRRKELQRNSGHRDWPWRFHPMASINHICSWCSCVFHVSVCFLIQAIKWMLISSSFLWISFQNHRMSDNRLHFLSDGKIPAGANSRRRSLVLSSQSFCNNAWQKLIGEKLGNLKAVLKYFKEILIAQDAFN